MLLALLYDTGFVLVVGLTDVPPAVLVVQAFQEFPDLLDSLTPLEVRVNVRDVLGKDVTIEVRCTTLR